MISALIVDDHVVFRRGLKQILAEEFSELHCGEAATADEAVQLVNDRRWDIVFLDIGIPGKTESKSSSISAALTSRLEPWF